MDALWTGYTSYATGERCPYPPDSQDAEDWRKGREIAQEEAENGGPEKEEG